MCVHGRGPLPEERLSLRPMSWTAGLVKYSPPPALTLIQPSPAPAFPAIQSCGLSLLMELTKVIAKTTGGGVGARQARTLLPSSLPHLSSRFLPSCLRLCHPSYLERLSSHSSFSLPVFLLLSLPLSASSPPLHYGSLFLLPV